MTNVISRDLLVNATATGSAVSWPGGRGSFMVVATDWSGATAKLQYKLPNGTWANVDTTNASFTTNGMCGFELPPGDIRVEIAGGTPAGIYAYAKGMSQ